MKNKGKPLKLMTLFIIGVIIAEILVTLTVFGFYYAFKSFTKNFENLYLSATSCTILFIAVISILLVSKIGKKVLRPVMNIQDAAKNVINGDFTVRLPEQSGILEVDEVATDFNIMVKELGNTEMLKDDFVTNVSHEFKTPLSVIEGYVTLLQGELSQEEKDECIKVILENTEKLSALTGNILAISKLENRALPLKKEKFRIDKQICNVMVGFNEAWEEKNIDVDLQLEPIEFYGFRILLTSVWSNLIQNAIKFSNAGGILKIVCKGDKDGILLMFSDNGIGMDEETKRHVFDKFYQGEESRSTEGNGLGLALVKKTVSLSDGNITVESELGKGTTFIIRLPNE